MDFSISTLVFFLFSQEHIQSNASTELHWRGSHCVCISYLYCVCMLVGRWLAFLIFRILHCKFSNLFSLLFLIFSCRRFFLCAQHIHVSCKCYPLIPLWQCLLFDDIDFVLTCSSYNSIMMALFYHIWNSILSDFYVDKDKTGFAARKLAHQTGDVLLGSAAVPLVSLLTRRMGEWKPILMRVQCGKSYIWSVYCLPITGSAFHM